MLEFWILFTNLTFNIFPQILILELKYFTHNCLRIDYLQINFTFQWVFTSSCSPHQDDSIILSDQTALVILFPLDRIHFSCSLLLLIMLGFSECSQEPISFTSGWRQAIRECLIQEHDIVTPAGTWNWTSISRVNYFNH